MEITKVKRNMKILIIDKFQIQKDEYTAMYIPGVLPGVRLLSLELFYLMEL